MDVVILDYDYPAFIEWLYHDYHPGLADEAYERQLEVRQETLFSGISMTDKLRQIGHDVHLIHYNNEYVQKTWAEEHGYDVAASGVSSLLSWMDSLTPRNLRKVFGAFDLRLSEPPWFYKTLEAQIREIEPDVIVNKTLAIEPEFFDQLSDLFDTLVGEITIPSHFDKELGGYDLIITPAREFYERLQRRDIRTAHIRFGFDEDIYTNTEPGERYRVSFVGSLTQRHSDRIELLEHLCETVGVDVWAPSIESLDADSPIRDSYHGVAWGREMYNVIRQSEMTLNRHIDTATGIVGNHRLYEATGLGTALVTDDKQALERIFEPGTEVITYNSPAECLDRIQYYLDNDTERQMIAERGRERTYSDHLYIDRAREYEREIESVLSK